MLMMKKTIFGLCFLLAILSTLWCCRNEEFSTEDSSQQRSYNSSARFASKSFWKEDEVYINKVQQVFMKVANMEHVKSRYDDLYWDYAMTFGQFGESYLLVPIVKDNRVVLLMEAVREGNKVNFFEKEDKGKIDFFHAVIFSKITDYGEKTDSQNSTSSRNAPVFQCSTRWITIGCTDKEPNCTPYTTSETVCKWIPGTTPKTFDPIGMDDGGGSGYEYPDPPEEKNPCEKTKNLLESQKIKNITEDLKSHMANGTGEKGWRDNKTGVPTQTSQNSGHSVNFGNPSTMNGGYHNHTGTGVNMFSATDIFTLIEIARYQNVGNVGNGYMGIMAPAGIHYVMYFNGNHGDLPPYGNYSESQLKNWNAQQWDDYLNMVGDNSISPNQILEQIFLFTLKKMGLQNKVTLQKIEDNKAYTITQNSDGTTTPVPCNN